jgi:hypothetical protein
MIAQSCQLAVIRDAKIPNYSRAKGVWEVNWRIQLPCESDRSLNFNLITERKFELKIDDGIVGSDEMFS